MIELEWEHIILDWSTYGGHRVARNRPRGQHDYAVRPNSDTWTGEPPWRPATREEGRAPETYNHEGLTYRFSFWSLRLELWSDNHWVYESARPDQRPVPFFGENGPFRWRIKARAWYRWDQGGGKGDHVAYFDAFDLGINDFIGADFVEVTPDPRAPNGWTASVNELGILNSPEIDPQSPVRVRALTPLYEFGSKLSFSIWTETQGVNLPGGSAPATIQDDSVAVNYNNVIDAIALYESAPVRERELLVVPEVVQLFGLVRVGGGGFGIGPDGFPFPIDPNMLGILQAMRLHAMAEGFNDHLLRTRLQVEALELIQKEAALRASRLKR